MEEDNGGHNSSGNGKGKPKVTEQVGDNKNSAKIVKNKAGLTSRKFIDRNWFFIS